MGGDLNARNPTENILCGAGGRIATSSLLLHILLDMGEVSRKKTKNKNKQW